MYSDQYCKMVPYDKGWSVRKYERYLKDDIPIIPYLKSNVGQNWDTVYSDIVRKFNRQTIEWLPVETKPQIINGTVYDSTGRFKVYNRGYVGFYVDPATNKLCMIEHKRWRPKKRIDYIVEYNGKTYWYNDVWWELELVYPKSNFVYATDVVIGETDLWGRISGKCFGMYGRSACAKSKKQAPKRVCKKLNQLVEWV